MIHWKRVYSDSKIAIWAAWNHYFNIEKPIGKMIISLQILWKRIFSFKTSMNITSLTTSTSLIFVGLAFRQPDLRSPYEEGAFHATHTGQQYYLWGEPWLNPGSNQQQMVYLNGIEIGISVKLLAFFRTDVDFMEMKHEVMLDPMFKPKARMYI